MDSCVELSGRTLAILQIGCEEIGDFDRRAKVQFDLAAKEIRCRIGQADGDDTRLLCSRFGRAQGDAGGTWFERAQAYLQQTVAQIRSDCQTLYTGLNERSWLRAYPSAANFFLVRFAGIAAEHLRASLEAQGIRAGWREDMPDCLRLTSQKPAENEYLLSVLDSIRAVSRKSA